MKNKPQPISTPTSGVVPTPITAHQSADLLSLKAQVFSPRLPDFEPFKSNDRVVVR
ncbi:hypothetical protein SPB21_03670 [Leptothoe sp. ISB3NOV94-8A]